MIEAVNGQKIGSPRDLALTVAAVTPGWTRRCRSSAMAQDHQVDVKVAEQPPRRPRRAALQPDLESHSKLGLALGPLTPDTRDQLQVPDGQKGALVRAVQPARRPRRQGCVRVTSSSASATRSVSSPSEANKAIGSALDGKDHAVALRVLRDGTIAFVGVAWNSPPDKDRPRRVPTARCGHAVAIPPVMASACPRTSMAV